MLDVSGRNLIVVGAGQGMGRQTSHALAQCGATVVCVDIIPERAKEVAAEMGGIPWVGDATDESDIVRLVGEAVDACGGPLHGLVDIVGGSGYVSLIDADQAFWDSQFELNFKHAHLVARHVGRHMVDAGTNGSMVFIASVNGLTASSVHGPYGAAKAALVSLVRTAAQEFGPHGIRVNAIAPGSILTPRVTAMIDEATKREAAELAPLGRMGVPSDIASVALFLTSDLAAYITGQTLPVDGGVMIRDPWFRGP
jgi:NAD(P)-dependent dehydrogenase (short-subunit alcohol dehydrogenase family)